MLSAEAPEWKPGRLTDEPEGIKKVNCDVSNGNNYKVNLRMDSEEGTWQKPKKGFTLKKKPKREG